MQWTPLPPEDSNGILTGYRIKYKTKLRGAKGNTLVVDGNDSSYTITGLEPGTQYMLRVAAVNQVCFGTDCFKLLHLNDSSIQVI